MEHYQAKTPEGTFKRWTFTDSKNRCINKIGYSARVSVNAGIPVNHHAPAIQGKSKGGFGVRIKHCGKLRKTTLYYFATMAHPLTVIAVCDCPVCGNRVFEQNAYDYAQCDYIQEWTRLKTKQHANWQRQIDAHLYCYSSEIDGTTQTPTVFKLHVGDYTALLATGNHLAIARRHA